MTDAIITVLFITATVGMTVAGVWVLPWTDEELQESLDSLEEAWEKFWGGGK